MIPVMLQSEPDDFDAEIRVKGKAFLLRIPNPTTKEFIGHTYWTKALPDLMRLYRETCAYTGLRLWTKDQSATVDHYLPKADYPLVAYDWNNFRLCTRSVNGWKGRKIVVDPFKIQPDWFYLDFNDLEIKVQNHNDAPLRKQLEDDIKSLGLNNRSIVDYRFEWYINYCEQEATFRVLKRQAYIVAHELKRQGLLLL